MNWLSNRITSRWQLCLLTLLGGIALFARFRFHAAFLFAYDDDFFYYLRIAQHLATKHVSTYDGIHLTNGYHPLWLIVLVVLVYVFPGLKFFYALQLILLVLTVVTWEMTRTCLLEAGVDHAPASSIATLAATASLALMFGGMEVALAIPCVLIAVAFRNAASFRWTYSQGFIYGTLLSLAVLSRLDVILLVALLAIVELPIYQKRNPTDTLSWGPRCCAFGIVAVTAMAYAAINYSIFSTLTPISGQAKQLRFHHWPCSTPWLALLTGFTRQKRLTAIWPSILVIFGAVISHLRRRRSIPISFYALIIFPFVHILVLSVLSDWSLWSWYLYPFVLAFIAGSAILLIPKGPEEICQSATGRNGLLQVISVIYLVGFTWSSYAKRPQDDVQYLHARDLQQFASGHHGIYAMGNGAGTPGYLVSDPFIQLEGLVMDKEYLGKVREELPLKQVLEDYGVRYYTVGVSPPLRRCYDLKEPFEAGPDSPALRDRFCEAPVAIFNEHHSLVLVFDLNPKR